MSENPTGFTRKSRDSFDLFKFIFCFGIMAVHVNPFGDAHFDWLHPWGRLLVPVYFMMSAFLFFSKYDRLPDSEKNAYLWKFVKRDLTLYLFWFIVWLPFTIVYRDYFHKGIVYFLGSILMGSTFPASWYLMALPIAIIIVAKLDRGPGRYLVPVIGFLLYLLCLGQNTWRILADKTVFLPKIYNATEISWSVTWCVAVIWIWIGRMFCRHEDSLQKASWTKVLILFIIALVLVFAEHRWLFTRGLFTMNNDVYFFGLFAAPMLFYIILKMDIHVAGTQIIRPLSTMIYCFHSPFSLILRLYILPSKPVYEMPWSIWCYLITAAVSLLVSWLILKGSKKIRILRYAY